MAELIEGMYLNVYKSYKKFVNIAVWGQFYEHILSKYAHFSYSYLVFHSEHWNLSLDISDCEQVLFWMEGYVCPTLFQPKQAKHWRGCQMPAYFKWRWKSDFLTRNVFVADFLQFVLNQTKVYLG